ncbi:hypothetical protein BKA70DRAFT_791620 [Coprinopsis sp. MPI-PUGE-AT-0042]|nr:hypothetical protein BKA70DRAFT_791620 [Coprinopsis sp. MPI-PUGE-AT-0042]
MDFGKWMSRCGEPTAKRCLALTGDINIPYSAIDERGEDLRVVVEDGVQLLLCQPWARWRLKSSMFSALVISCGGLSNLLKAVHEGQELTDLLLPSEAYAALQELSVVGWVDFKLFNQVEDASAFPSLRSLMLSRTLDCGIQPIQEHFPSSLRHLHLDGTHQYHTHIIFAIAQLEELVFSCNDFSPCRFESLLSWRYDCFESAEYFSPAPQFSGVKNGGVVS